MSILLLLSCFQSPASLIENPIELKADYYPEFGLRRILIDPGHGCEDSGAVMRVPYSQKPMPMVQSEGEINLSLAKVLQSQLNASGHYDARLSHDGEKCPSLGQRAALASSSKAEVLISLHSDSGSSRAEGTWLIWSKHGHAAKQAEQNSWLATALGAGLYEHGFPIYHKDSVYDADDVSIERYLRTHDHYGVHIDNGKIGLQLLKKSKLPAVLIETHFISSPSSVLFFHRDETMVDFAIAIEDGLRTYFATNDGVHDPFMDDKP